MALLITFLFIPTSANALLLGENASTAKNSTLKQARRHYQKGLSHQEVWKKTGWYCPQGINGRCRWESKPCTGIGKIKINTLERTVKGAVPLHRVFRAACIYKQYPSMRNGIKVYLGDCNGYGGYAKSQHGNNLGEICISPQMLQAIEDAKDSRPKRTTEPLTKPISAEKKRAYKSRIEEAKKQLHRLFLHEMQHHIQFVEKWPVSRANCPYKLRQMEVEAYHTYHREDLSSSEKRRKAPHWWRNGLC